MNHFEFNWRTPDGLELFFQGWQPESKPKAVICLVHGLGEHCGRYEYLRQAVTDSGYALLTFDQRGHGRSEGRRGHAVSYKASLDDVTHLLEEARRRFPGKPCFLYGHSLGGSLVINYVLRRKPELNGVIVTSPWLRLAFRIPVFQLIMVQILNAVWPTFHQENSLDVRLISHDKEVVDAYKNDKFVHDRISARLFTDSYRASCWALKQAKNFSLPLLLMHGNFDQITSFTASRQFALRVPGDCCLKIWKGFRHELHNESKREEVFTFLVSWLETHV